MPQNDSAPDDQAPASASTNLDTAASANGQYGSEQIKVLEGLEAVRKRPGMYIGGTGMNGLHHLIWETVDNAIDEAMAGFATIVTVLIQADGSCCVTDDGRGIPVDPISHDDPQLDGKPAIEVVMTRLHAGGKFGEEGSAYKVSGGLHGVGVSCVNALSDYLEAEVYRDGKVYMIEFERGQVTKELHVVGDIPSGSTRKTGTKVIFHPDPEIFAETDFDYTYVQNRLRELSFLNPGITINLTDERVDEDGKPRSDTFRAKDGLVEYIEYLMTGKTAVSAPVHILKEDQEQGFVCEVAFQYHDGYSETILSFANNINNVDGGTHASGFKVALTRSLNSYARKSGIIREKDPTPTGEDLREGLIAIVSVKLAEPTFNNQPKEKLLNPEIEGFTASAVSQAFESWLEEHPAEAKRLAMKGIVAAQAREAARKARELTRRKSALESGSMPHKLRDCKTKDVNRSELFIVEGDSAGGSATQGRDVETQAILPLKGKILNVEKARVDKMLAFEEIRTLISALRCGIGNDLDISKLRYGKIIIMTDADVDGSHIRTLLLTFFFRQMTEIVKRGRIYIAQPPLYQIVRGKKTRYVLDDKEMNDVLTEIALDGATLIIRDIDNVQPEDGETLSPSEPIELRRLSGNEAEKLVKTLRRLAELVEIAERRGVKFPDLLAIRSNDPEGMSRLPSHRVSWQGGEEHAWSEHDALGIVETRQLRMADTVEEESPLDTDGGDGTDEVVAPDPRPLAAVRELHENRELEKLFVTLESLGLSIDDYALTREESVTGEKMPAKYVWTTSAKRTSSDNEGDAPAERQFEATNLAQILDALLDIGRRGMEVKRFKGLGEMDAEQLWETTMDPSCRTMLRVTMERAQQAETLFATLMGEHVEPRRKFIEDHALEVKNLDV